MKPKRQLTLVERLLSRAWAHRRHRALRAEAAAELERLQADNNRKHFELNTLQAERDRLALECEVLRKDVGAAGSTKDRALQMALVEVIGVDPDHGASVQKIQLVTAIRSALAQTPSAWQSSKNPDLITQDQRSAQTWIQNGDPAIPLFSGDPIIRI